MRLELPCTYDVNELSGSFQARIPLKIPSYHQIEPKLALAYDSEARDGLVGWGWRLEATSYLERASPGRGAAHFDATDHFFLDGQELLPCIAGSPSPSCTTGGTHSTKAESYTRVRYDATTDQWTVTYRDGARCARSCFVIRTRARCAGR